VLAGPAPASGNAHIGDGNGEAPHQVRRTFDREWTPAVATAKERWILFVYMIRERPLMVGAVGRTGLAPSRVWDRPSACLARTERLGVWHHAARLPTRCVARRSSFSCRRCLLIV